MLSENSRNLNELYQTYLAKIKGIAFTQREVDVIALIVYSEKAQLSNKDIANQLSLDSPRGVESQIRNITQKIGGKRKQAIREFIVDSDNSEHLKAYYALLDLQNKFE